MGLVLSRKDLLSAQPWGGRKYKKVLGKFPPGSFAGPCCAFLTSSPVSWPGVHPHHALRRVGVRVQFTLASLPGLGPACFCFLLPASPVLMLSPLPETPPPRSRLHSFLTPSRSLIKHHQSPSLMNLCGTTPAPLILFYFSP